MRTESIALLTPVLDRPWIDGVLKAAELEVPTDTSAAIKLAAKVSSLGSQRTVAAFCINATAGNIKADALNTIINDECGGRGSERIGAHFLSLARTGKLAGLRADITLESKARVVPNFESVDEAVKAFDRILSRVPDTFRDAFITHAKTTLSPAPSAEPTVEPTIETAPVETVDTIEPTPDVVAPKKKGGKKIAAQPAAEA
jgi:hypothetical protein